MKIAQIVCCYSPYYSGMGNVVFQTASHLGELGHNVTVFTPGYYEKKEIKSVEAPVAAEHSEELEAEIDYAKRLKPALSYGNAAYIPDLKKELNAFDLVHLHYPFFGTANLVRKWKQRHSEIPLVITYHMDTRGTGWKGLFFKYYADYWLPKILAAGDRLITSSFDYIAASDVFDSYKKQPEKWIELPFGVDTERFQPRDVSAEWQAAWNLEFNPDLPTLLFVGGMDTAHYFKGISVLLKAVRLLKESSSLVQAIFVGEGELRTRYEQEAIGLGVANLVRFVGQVSEDDLPLFYNLADLLILPSTTRGEAFGMVILEAMASGVPVVVSDIPGVRAVAADGGILAEPGNPHDIADGIKGYFLPENDRAAWRARVRKITEEKYGWKPIIKRLNEVYESCK